MQRGSFAFKIGDLIILTLVLVATVLSIYYTYFTPYNQIQVTIKGETEQYLYPLNAHEEIVVNGPLGSTIVCIENGQVWVKSSPCTNQLCVQSGHISLAGGVLACLPNAVMVTLQGTKENPYDVIAG